MVETSDLLEQLQDALPDLSRPVAPPGLDGSVDIIRDSFGIPHIRAGSTKDAFFAQGFATAQDRLWHMEYDRRRAYGRWAEVAGPAALEQDVLMRRLRLEHSAKLDYEAALPETRAMLDSYAAGVNAFIQSTARLPIEFTLTGTKPQQWQPWDGLAVFKVRHVLMGVFEAKLWRARLVQVLGAEATSKLFPGYEQGDLLIVPPGLRFDGPVEDALADLDNCLGAIEGLASTEAGSNNWALDGSRTASGKPLVGGDPHRALEVPNVYYQNHLSCPDFDVIGLSFPGLPGFPHFGHNRHVCWCVTHANADYQDLFVEQFHPDDPTRYLYQDTWRQADVVRETIHVKGSQPVEIEAAATHHGPIIGGDPHKGYGLALKYTAIEQPNTWADCLLQMLRGDSADAMDEAMRLWVDPVNSFVFADIQGNIRYLMRGKVPQRSSANRWLPVPGWTGEHEWEDCIPFEELPRTKSPDTSYVVTANNRIAGSDYPYYIAFDYAPGFRAERITSRLEKLGNDAAAEVAPSIHAERTSIPATDYLRVLADVVPLDSISTQAMEHLASWDGSMERDGSAPMIYSAFQVALVKRMVGFIFGPLREEALSDTGRGGAGHVARLRARFAKMALANDRSLLPEGVEWRDILAEALRDGCAYLEDALGPGPALWKWGALHKTAPTHPLSVSFPEHAPALNPPSYPMGGDGDTPQAASYSMGQPFYITSTSVARYVFDMADWGRSAWVVPLGGSGHPGSPHYADQAPLWADVRMAPMLYDWDEIGRNSETSQTLFPLEN